VRRNEELKFLVPHRGGKQENTKMISCSSPLEFGFKAMRQNNWVELSFCSNSDNSFFNLPICRQFVTCADLAKIAHVIAGGVNSYEA
jgi:hypothetical protein